MIYKKINFLFSRISGGLSPPTTPPLATYGIEPENYAVWKIGQKGNKRTVVLRLMLW
jgi:hypothetical protein